MPIRGVDATGIQTLGLTAEDVRQGIGAKTQQLQAIYDRAAAQRAEQLAAVGQLQYIDAQAREEALNSQRKRFEDAIRKNRGNLAKGYNDFQGVIAENLSDPWIQANKYHVEQFNAQNQLKQKLGSSAIVLNDVSKQKLVKNSTNNQYDLEKITANVIPATEYSKFVADTFSKMRASVRQGGLYRNKKIQHILESKSYEELTREDIKELVNDDAFINMFMNSTTAKLDNRVSAGYDPETGTNMFTGEPGDKSFKSGASEYAFGVLANQAYTKEGISRMQDDLAVDAIKRGRDGAQIEAAKMRGITSQEVTDLNAVTDTYSKMLKSGNFDKNGRYVAKDKGPGIFENFVINYYPFMSDEYRAKYKKEITDRQQKAEAEMEVFSDLRKSYPELSSKTDVEIAKFMEAATTNLLSQTQTFLQPSSTYKEVIAEKLIPHLDERKVLVETVDGKRKEFPRGSANDIYKMLNFSNRADFLAKNPKYSQSMSGVRVTAPKGTNIGAMAAKVTLLDNNGKEVYMWIERDEQISKEGTIGHFNNVYQSMGKDPIVNDWDNNSGRMYSTVMDLNIGKDPKKFGFDPTTYEHLGRVSFNGEDFDFVGNNRLSLEAQRKKLSEIRQASLRTGKSVYELTDGTLRELPDTELEERAKTQLYNAGERYVDQSVNLRGTYQQDKPLQ